ncbi:yip1 domain-containing protein, partial [Moniliophthora roreri]
SPSSLICHPKLEAGGVGGLKKLKKAPSGTEIVIVPFSVVTDPSEQRKQTGQKAQQHTRISRISVDTMSSTKTAGLTYGKALYMAEGEGFKDIAGVETQGDLSVET